MPMRTLSWAALPLLLLALITAGFLALDPLRPFTASAPPIEEITVERTVLDPDGILLTVRADGSEPIRIAQVQVDGAYWAFTQQPGGALDRLATAAIRIPYPWVTGEAHRILLVTSTGATFEHEIPVAVSTPQASFGELRLLGMIGLFVGVVPVALGMLFYPALRSGGPVAFEFVLALTIGLLGFLFVDTLEEGLEIAGEAASALQGPALVWLAAALTFSALFALQPRTGKRSGVGIAAAIALGIGLHNFGEGLAIGAAFATGAAALGSFLVVGFTLHNITEGVGIVAPLTARTPHITVFAALAALAGLPAVVGIWLGSLAFSPHWAALALGIGAGAIAQVVVEVTFYLRSRATAHDRSWLSGTTFSGVATGVVVMYATALLVQA